MTDLLKVLKIVGERAFAVLKSIRYKGLYAFLCGVIVFSLCFKGKGEIVVIDLRTSSNSAQFSQSLTDEQSVPLSGATVAEDGEREQKKETEGLALNASEHNNRENSEYGAVPMSKGAAASSPVGYAASSEEARDETEPLALSEEIGVEDISEENSETEAEPNTDEGQSEESSDKWLETAERGTRYVNTEGIYSRAEAVEGSEKVKRYGLNEKVTVTAKTDTDYYKLDSGAFIHADYLSEEETPKWTETETSGLMYVRTGGVYSRAEAVEGSEKVEKYGLNETVTVTAITDTGYYKLDNGAFIHSDYLSKEETPKWTETAASGLMYVCRGGIYSRVEAIEGSTKVKQYSLNDAVNVAAKTDTGYYKLDTGEFIHSDYLSATETTEYAISGRYGQRAQSDWEKDLAQQVVDIVNGIRAEYGLNPLKQLDSLTAAAVERAWETTFYTSHTRPDGTSCFTVLSEYGLSNPSAKGENIAYWSSSAQAVVNSWMNDYSHRVNILGNYEYIGVGCYYIAGDYYGYYWTQDFYSP